MSLDALRSTEWVTGFRDELYNKEEISIELSGVYGRPLPNRAIIDNFPKDGLDNPSVAFNVCV